MTPSSGGVMVKTAIIVTKNSTSKAGVVNHHLAPFNLHDIGHAVAPVFDR